MNEISRYTKLNMDMYRFARLISKHNINWTWIANLCDVEGIFKSSKYDTLRNVPDLRDDDYIKVIRNFMMDVRNYHYLPKARLLITEIIKEIQPQLTDKEISDLIKIVQEYVGEDISNLLESDWRKESSVKLGGDTQVSNTDERRIWGNGEFRIFLSHKSEFKAEATELKEMLKKYGVSCFVAHEDIEPRRDWQEEIEKALFSMDALVALMTDKFHDSFWTDQEIGVAFGRGVPIIAVKLGIDPYGFIGKFQALVCSWDITAKQILQLLINNDNDKMISAYLKTVKNCQNDTDANTLSEILPGINKLSEEHINSLLSAFNENDQVKNSSGFSGKKPFEYGNGLVHHLNRLSDRQYEYTEDGNIRVKQ